MKNSAQGFTLIELVVVIIILGILAATALPKFIDLSSDAEAAALQGVAGAANSGFAVNFAGCAVDPTNAAKCPSRMNAANTNCTNALPAVLTGGVPTGYTVAASAHDCSAGAGTTYACTISQTSTGNTANANLVCTR